MKDNIGYIIAFGIICIVAIFVIITQTNETPIPAAPQTNSNYTIIICPNPECPMHSPITHASYPPRPIEMSVDQFGYAHYLCQYCGANWDETHGS